MNRIDIYKRIIKYEKLEIKTESNFAFEEFVRITDSILRKLESIIHSLYLDNYFMNKAEYDTIYAMKDDAEYIYYLNKRITEIDLITHEYDSEYIESTNKYIPKYYEQFICLIVDLPKPDNTLSETLFEKMILSRKYLRWALGADLDTQLDELIKQK